MPIAYGVEDLQIQYVLVDNSVIDEPTPSQFQNIRQVRVTLRVHSAETDPRTNERRTTELSATFSARNLGYKER